MSNGKHLAKGSTAPTLPDDGKIRLYSMRFCPFAQRVHHVLAVKGIPHHVIYINLTEKPEWYFAINPSGKVPAIQLNSNKILYESMIVSDYLDEQYPEPALYPADPFKKAQDKLLIERFSAVFTVFYKIFGPHETSPSVELFAALDTFETELINRGTPYFSGTKPGMVDYMIWPWFERFEMVKIMYGNEYEMDAKRFPKLLNWRAAMEADPVVKEHWVSPEDYVRFMKSRSTGVVDYDFLA